MVLGTNITAERISSVLGHLILTGLIATCFSLSYIAYLKLVISIIFENNKQSSRFIRLK